MNKRVAVFTNGSSNEYIEKEKYHKYIDSIDHPKD